MRPLQKTMVLSGVLLYADKEYAETPNNQALEELCLQNKIMRKGN